MGNFVHRKIWVSISDVTQNQLTKYSINSKAKYVSFNLDKMFPIKMVKNQYFKLDEYYTILGVKKALWMS